MAHVGAPRFGDDVLRPLAVDPNERGDVVRDDDRREVKDRIHTVTRAAERLRVAHVSLPHIDAEAFEANASGITGENQAAHGPARAKKPLDEAHAHDAGGTGDQGDARHSVQPLERARPVDGPPIAHRELTRRELPHHDVLAFQSVVAAL